MTPEQLAAMIDKVGVAITMLVVIIPCTFWLARLYIASMNKMIESNAAHAKQLAAIAEAAIEERSESTKALARNTVATDNQSAKAESLATEIRNLAGKIESCRYLPNKA